MDELIAFVTARLDEDEATAAAASSGHPNPESRDGRWQDVGDRHVRYDNGAGETLRSVDVTGGPCMWHEQIRVTGDTDGRVAAHIVRHDPARVLREVAAKRAMVAEHQPWPAQPAWCGRCHEPIPDAREDADSCCPLDWPCPTIRALATIWSDHPHYRLEWGAAA